MPRLPKGDNIVIGVSMPRMLDDALLRAADKLVISKSAYIRLAIVEKIEREKRPR